MNQADLNQADFCSGSGRFAVHARQLASFQQEALAAPDDGVAGEAPGPEGEGDQRPTGDQELNRGIGPQCT